MKMFKTIYESPIGKIKLTCTDKGLSGLYFDPPATENYQDAHQNLKSAIEQLNMYFSKKLQVFDLDLDLTGTPFQMKVWEELSKVKYGKTTTYSAIAHNIGNPKAVRAVGMANGRNPVSIIVPCHRTIGSNNKLIGYGGGLWRKEWLLKHEGALLI